MSNLFSQIDELEAKVKKYEAAIRKHRDQRGDDRCWIDDEELYGVLPEGHTPPVRDTFVELKNCERFIVNRHNPKTDYCSPQRRIEQLEQANLRLHDQIVEMQNRLSEIQVNPFIQPLEKKEL